MAEGLDTMKIAFLAIGVADHIWTLEEIVALTE